MTSCNDICIKFLSKKVNKVRFRPPSKSPLVAESCNVFVAGSWDDEANALYMLKCPEKNNDMKEKDNVTELEEEPQLITEVPHAGDITDIEFLSQDFLITSSSLGSVFLYRCDDQNLVKHCSWEKIHCFTQSTAPCSSVSVMGDNVVSVGEDCRLILINTNRKKPERIIDEADSCCLTAISYLRQHEAVTGNIRGYLKLWDFRSSQNKPSRVLLMSGGQATVTCMSRHPTQLHTLASGGEDGTLCIWDLRQERQPVTILSAHSMAMMEVRFHPTNPDHLFTCSQDGSVWHWNASILKSTVGGIKGISKPSEIGLTVYNPWLNCDASKHRLEIQSLLQYSTLPINSLDIRDNALICGSDNEALYIITGFDF